MSDAEARLGVLEHRVSVLEEEQLPKRMAVIEPAVARIDGEMDDLIKQVGNGLSELKTEIVSQKALMRGVAATIIFIVALVQFLPYLGKLM